MRKGYHAIRFVITKPADGASAASAIVLEPFKARTLRDAIAALGLEPAEAVPR